MTDLSTGGTNANITSDIIGAAMARPWGHYVVLSEEALVKLKRIVVLPGGRLSLQRHQFRREHWFVVEGVAQVELDGEVMTLHAGQSVDIPMRAWHRLANTAGVNLELVEIQCGDYFGEDDIERMADDYGRVGQP